MPGALHPGLHQGYATVPHPSFMPAPWPQSILDDLKSHVTAREANAYQAPPAQISEWASWGAPAFHSRTSDHLSHKGVDPVQPSHTTSEAGIAAGWQPLQSSWKGAALQPSSLGSDVPATDKQAPFAPCRPGATAPMPSAKHTLGPMSAYDLPSRGFLKFQPSLAAAWDVDGIEQATSSQLPAAWPAAASPFGHQAIQHRPQGSPAPTPAANACASAMDWQPSPMPHAAEDARSAMANPRRQNSTAVHIAPPSAGVSHSLHSASAETRRQDGPPPNHSMHCRVVPGSASDQQSLQARAEKQTSKSRLQHVILSGEEMPRLLSSQSVPTFKVPSSRSVKTPSALHSSLGWECSSHMQHDFSGLEQSSLTSTAPQQSCGSLHPVLGGPLDAQQSHHGEPRHASGKLLTDVDGSGVFGALHPFAKYRASLASPPPKDLERKPGQGSAAEQDQKCEDHRKQGLTSSKGPGLVRLSTGGETPHWHIPAHDWRASGTDDPMQPSVSDKPSAAHSMGTGANQLHAIKGDAQDTEGSIQQDSEDIAARPSTQNPRSPAHMHDNPLYNDNTQGVPLPGLDNQLQMNQSGEHPILKPLSMDMGVSTARHERSPEPSLSTPAADQEDLRLSQTRFSGTGTAPPQPKRMALGSGPCSPVDTRALLRRALSEPLCDHAFSQSSLLPEASHGAHAAAPAPLHAEPHFVADNLPVQLEMHRAAAGTEHGASPVVQGRHQENMDRGHLLEMTGQAGNERMEQVGAMQEGQQPEVDARSIPSRGPSSAAVSSSAGASAFSSRQSSRTAVAWPNWAEIQAQCSSAADLAAASALNITTRPQPLHASDLRAVSRSQGNSNVPMQMSLASSAASLFPAPAPLPLSLPDGLNPFHLERPSHEHGMHSALFVAPHPHDIMPRRGGPDPSPEQASRSDSALPGSGSLQRTNSFNNRMRSWFLKRKA